jgi:predicted histone-like DNA-binding protein
MAKYRIYQNTNDKSNGFGKYYARKKSQGMIDLNGLISHMVGHNSAFSEGTISGVLRDMVGCVRELAYEGYSVKIDNLGIFFVSMKSKGVDDANKFNAQSDITSKWRAMPTGDTSGRAIGITRAGGALLTWKEDDNYTSPRTKTAGGTTVDEG